MRTWVGDDRNYDILNAEVCHLQSQCAQLSTKESPNNIKLLIQATAEAQNNGTELTTEQIDKLYYHQSDALIKLQARLHEARRWRDAIKHEKKILEGMGKQSSDAQVKKAKKKRPIENEQGITLDAVIRELARVHPDEKPGELWPHFKTAIEEWSDNECTEAKTAKHDSWRYHFKIVKKKGSKIVEKVDSITFGMFRKKLHK